MSKKFNVHSIGLRSDEDWDGIGTHPIFGIGECGEIGDLTDCASNITCLECQWLFRRKEEKTNHWLEIEWLRNRVYKLENKGTILKKIIQYVSNKLH